jgi:Tol biopolymer transport system component
MDHPPDHLAQALAGRYRIERKLGQGGMATVYLAEDLKHHRRVAIKVLRPELAALLGAERFLKEIEVTASLQHPHILPLFDSGYVERPGALGPCLYYVMPFVEGETLRDRLQREGELPVGEAIRIASEIAAALDHAHRHGVVHRDIKPENILLSEGVVLVADFGIALALAQTGGPRLTGTGFMLGTPDYMSPEQAAGESGLDARTDVYALGTVLHEMLTGRAPYAGAGAAEAVSRRLTEPVPPVSRGRPEVSRTVERVLLKALARDPADRFSTAAEFREALARAAVSPSQRRSPLPIALGVVAIAIVTIVLSRGGREAPAVGEAGTLASALARRLSPLTARAELEEWPAWAPDGRQLVYTAEVEGYKKLFVRDVETGTERQLTTGRQDDIQPAWSPDGRSIAFVRSSLPRGKLEPTDVLGWYAEGGDIWVLDLSSRRERQVVANAFDPAWSPDGTRLAFDAAWAGPRRIWVTDSGGRNPRQVSTDSSDAVVHAAPGWSPDGEHLVFRSVRQTRSDIAALALATGATTWVTDDNVPDLEPAWSPSGRYIYFTSSRGGGLNIWRIPVSADGAPGGAAEQLTTGAGDDRELGLSPDGKRLAFSVLGINSDVWRLPVNPMTGKPTGEPGPVTSTTRTDSRGAWSPDGKAIAFNSDRSGEMNIWVHSLADGSDRQVTTGSGGDYQPQWSPDGTRLVFFSARSGNNDIWSVRLANGELTQLTRGEAIETNPFYSPDGKRIAYHSDQGGRLEVWVMAADGSNPKAVTSGGVGGHFMRWLPDSHSLLFRSDAPGAAGIQRLDLESGSLERLPDVQSGAHISLSPDRSLILDVRGHKVLWVYPVSGAAPYSVFQFASPDLRIDYPVWSPDGRWVLFDHAEPRGGDIWLLEGVE